MSTKDVSSQPSTALNLIEKVYAMATHERALIDMTHTVVDINEWLRYRLATADNAIEFVLSYDELTDAIVLQDLDPKKDESNPQGIELIEMAGIAQGFDTWCKGDRA